jgi:plasmid stabilization system protein ParE
MKLRLSILPRADADAQRIYDWLAERSPGGASRWFAAFNSAAQTIVANPASYSLAPENEHVDYELRQFFFKTPYGRTYRGIFTVVGDEVLLLRVRGPDQAPLGPDEIE